MYLLTLHLLLTLTRSWYDQYIAIHCNWYFLYLHQHLFTSLGVTALTVMRGILQSNTQSEEDIIWDPVGVAAYAHLLLITQMEAHRMPFILSPPYLVEFLLPAASALMQEYA